MLTDADKAKEQLQGILDKNEYQIYYEDNRNFLEVWWDRLTNWIGEQLAKIFSGLEPSSGFADLVLFIIIAAVFVLIGIVVFQRVRFSQRRRDLTEYKPLKSLNEANWSFDNHLQTARQQEESGNYTDAARHVFLALLLYFDEKEWVKARNWKTNWEYFAELQQVNKQWAESFYQLALVFDEVVYGKRKLEKDAYFRYRNEALKWLNGDLQKISDEG